MKLDELDNWQLASLVESAAQAPNLKDFFFRDYGHTSEVKLSEVLKVVSKRLRGLNAEEESRVISIGVGTHVVVSKKFNYKSIQFKEGWCGEIVDLTATSEAIIFPDHSCEFPVVFDKDSLKDIYGNHFMEVKK